MKQAQTKIVNIKGFEVHINSTDEGVVIDIYDREALKAGPVDPIASTWAMDQETEQTE